MGDNYMERTLERSSIISNLEDRIQKGDATALQNFWNEIENKGTPLIEEIEGDSENNLVTFIYRAEEGIENVVFIPPVGMDKLQENKMERLLETDLWYISCKMRNDVHFCYYFSPNDPLDDDWEKRGDRMVHDIYNKNRIIFKDENGKKDNIRCYVTMPKAEEYFWNRENKDVPKGSIYEHQLKSENLEKERRVRVYTPYGYSEEKEDYKFIVLTDGDEYINVLLAANVLDNLIAANKIPPIVAVFIDSTEKRMEELKCNDKFGDVIVKDLLSLVKINYNISNKPEDAIIGGLSLGGLTAAYLGLKHSEVFGNVISQSGSFWYKPESYEGNDDCWLGTQFKEIDKLPLRFYLNVGVLEHKERMIGTNIKLRDTLIEKGYEVGFETFKSGHDYLSWGETLAYGLISLIGNR
jgi:enterochelin esterase family protein